LDAKGGHDWKRFDRLKLSKWEEQLDEIETNRRPETPSFDPAEVAMSLRWFITSAEAVRAGKASLIPRFGPMPAPSPAKAAALRGLDMIAARLMAERHP
jgi:hypothetical protein